VVSAAVSEAAVGTAVVLEEVGLVPVAAIGPLLAVGPQEVEADLKIEREWRERLQEASVTDKENLAVAKQEIDFLRLLETIKGNSCRTFFISNLIYR